MRQGTDNIEIKDPPLEELTKKHSCLKRTCVSCCSFLVVLVLISFVILKLTLGPETRTVKTLPREFMRAVPLYDPENIETIKLTAGSGRSRGVETAAFVPKLVVAPLLLIFDRDNTFIRKYRPELSAALDEGRTDWEKFSLFLEEPVGDHRDIVHIDWHGLTADRTFIAEYYETELKKKNFQIANRTETNTVSQFTFNNDSIDGVVYIEDQRSTEPTDFVSLTITMDLSAE
ncbi:MAG: hypothetical protein UY92_C0021G0006 [Candidatus Magasanikbacteria bacterium GW2011_GWA2_56_11]|uniref:Uncharacterized protein n=1 Tax=Candidatus Magasanikbacteria bacterium GW2011_GWA2_56_11 TaxID=1619044 RepID=A0A0G2AJG4_9BACT|nr:MAG: hypothetical protein UY92_C0021G0006 [Candidatus Magasanikbacteria bacterium GW2011_GWA2_56_11]